MHSESLELADTEALQAELLRRHDAGLIVLARSTRDGGGSEYSYSYSGGLAAAIGMAALAAARLTRPASLHQEGGDEQ
jgi:hypothetical protein